MNSFYMSSRQLLLPAVVLAFATSLAGCNKQMPRATVTGAVTFEGQPVTGGIIYFVPESGPQASAVLDDQGRYRLETPGTGSGAVYGHHTVYFSPVFDESEELSEEDYIANKPPPERKHHLKLPQQYQSLQTSELSADVNEGSNEVNFNLPIQ